MFDKQSLVVQANKLIMTPQAFSLDEKKFILCLISKITPLDKDFEPYRIHFDEYASFIGQDYHYVKQALPKITKSIMQQILEIWDDEEEILKQRAIIIGSTHYKKYGYVDVQFHPDLRDVLLDLREKFTQYNLEYALHMKSKHSIRLYEIIKANKFKEQKKFQLSWSYIPKPLQKEFKELDIQKLLGTDYKRFIDFERRVLKSSQEEMKKHTDVYFEYEKVKISRYLCAIDFFIQDNVPTETHHQVTIFDIIPPIDRERIKTPKEMAIEAEKAIENLDRGKLCQTFQDAVKREYGFDFPLGLLEGISNLKITELLPNIGNLGIIHRDRANSVIKYIQKALRSKKQTT